METLVVEYKKDGAKYCRNKSESRIILEKELLKLYDRDENDYKACVFNSGMSAISSILNILAAKGRQYFLIGDELYSDTPKICKYLTRYNKEYKYSCVDIRDDKKILEIFEIEKPTVFYIESSTNPSGQIFNYDLILKLKNICPDCLFIVDNTWLSAINFNPFNYGVDIVLESMTKYISGGRCIGGHVIGPNLILDKLKKYSKINGVYVGSDHCDIFLEGLSTLESRIKVVSSIAYDVAQYLENNKNVTRVMYPKLESHPAHKNFKYVKYGPGCLLFHIISPINKTKIAKTFLSNIPDLHFETSFGSSHSKIDQYPNIGSSKIYDSFISNNDGNNDGSGDEDSKYNSDEIYIKKGIWIRLAIGYTSNLTNIICSLENLFEQNNNLSL